MVSLTLTSSRSSSILSSSSRNSFHVPPSPSLSVPPSPSPSVSAASSSGSSSGRLSRADDGTRLSEHGRFRALKRLLRHRGCYRQVQPRVIYIQGKGTKPRVSGPTIPLSCPPSSSPNAVPSFLQRSAASYDSRRDDRACLLDFGHSDAHLR